jgi:hypothetical protein
VDRAAQEVDRRREVGVEDRDVLALGDLHPRFERPCLVAGPVRAMQVRDVQAARGVAPDRLLGNPLRLVRGIVEDLDFEQVARIVELAYRVDEPVGDVHLVVDRKLDRHRRQGGELSRGLRYAILVLHVQVHQVIAVPPVDSENDENEKVCRENEGLGGRHIVRMFEDNDQRL